MKKSLLFSFFASLCTMGFSQITITSDDLPGVGFMANSHKDTDESTYATPSFGADQTWDYSNLVADEESTYAIKAPSETPYASKYTDATMVIQDAHDTSSYAFLKDNGTSGYVNTGIVFYNAFAGGVNHIDPSPDLGYWPTPFDNTLDASYTASGSNSTLSMDVSITVKGKGYGSLTTPAGTFNNVLLIEQINSTTVTASGVAVPVTTTTYSFYQKGGLFLLLQVIKESQTLFGSTTTTYESIYYSSTEVGLETDNLNAGISAFPTNVENTLNISTDKAPNNWNLTVHTLTGTVVKESLLTNSSTELEVSDLNPGMYVMTISDDNGALYSKKFIKE